MSEFETCFTFSYPKEKYKVQFCAVRVNRKLSLLSSEECGSQLEYTSSMTSNFKFRVTAESKKKAEEMDGLSETDMKERQAVAESVDKELSVRLAGCRVSLYGSSLPGFGLKFSTINLHLSITKPVQASPRPHDSL